MLTWNVRGMGKAAKFLEVGSYLQRLNISLAALLEVKVRQVKAQRIRQRLGNNWEFLDNYEHNDSGRIWIMWKTGFCKVECVDSSDQHMHCLVL